MNFYRRVSYQQWFLWRDKWKNPLEQWLEPKQWQTKILKCTVSFNIPPILVVVVGLRVFHHQYHVTIIRKIVILSNKFKGRKFRHEIGQPSGGMNKRFVSSRAKTYPLFTPLEIIPRCIAVRARGPLGRRLQRG